MNTRAWVALGYGVEGEIVAKLTGQWVLIRDDYAAEAGGDSCWIATPGDDVGPAARAYEAAGGGVSYVALVDA